MNKCLICNNVIEESFDSLFGNDYKICYECFNNFKIRNSKFKIEEVEGLILYYYDEFFKDLLYKYKGCYDYVLKDAFITYNISCLKKIYKGYVVVLAPSNKDDELKRGFNHLEEIFKCLKMPLIKCFVKDEKWKQSEKTLSERRNIQNVIKIDISCLKGIKKVLIVDDVLTSGSTIKALIKQIPTSIYKKVLVLSSNCRILANEIV